MTATSKLKEDLTGAAPAQEKWGGEEIELMARRYT